MGLVMLKMIWILYIFFSLSLYANPTSNSVLFVFDVDETLTNLPYKGESAKLGHVHLKPGIAKMFSTILSLGHLIGIATANVSPDLESFLMDELGFDYTNEKHYLLFRSKIRIKQPDLTLFLRNAQPLKRSKLKMIRQLAREYTEDGHTIDGIIFTDDKLYFHKQILDHKLSHPYIGIKVGYRKNEDKNFHHDEFVEPGHSVEFIRFLGELPFHKDIMNHLFRQGDGTLISESEVRNYNKELRLSNWYDKTITKMTITENKNLAQSLLSTSNTSLPTRVLKLKKERIKNSPLKYKKIRRFYRNQEPIKPRYL